MNNKEQQLKELRATIEKANEQIKAINAQPEFEVEKVYKWNGSNPTIGIMMGWCPDFPDSIILRTVDGDTKRYNSCCITRCVPATIEEWEAALKAEFKSRYKPGMTVELHVGKFKIPENINLVYSQSNDILDVGGYPGNVYHKGQWATIVSQPPQYEKNTWYADNIGCINFNPANGKPCGINEAAKWVTDNHWFENYKDWHIASQSEVQAAFEKLGFKQGVKFRSAMGLCQQTLSTIRFDSSGDIWGCDLGGCIFKASSLDLATIIKDEPLFVDALRGGKHKVEFVDNNTIGINGVYFSKQKLIEIKFIIANTAWFKTTSDFELSSSDIDKILARLENNK